MSRVRALVVSVIVRIKVAAVERDIQENTARNVLPVPANASKYCQQMP